MAIRAFEYDEDTNTLREVEPRAVTPGAPLVFVDLVTQEELDAALAGLGAGGGTALVITTQTASYTLALADVDTLVRMDSATAVTLTVPPNGTVPIPVGKSILVNQRGGGQVTLAPGSGVTLNSRGGALKTAGQFAQASLTKTATNEWLISGDLVA